MTMRVDQSGQQRLLAKVDSFLPRVSRGNPRKFSNINNSISGNRDGAVLNWRAIHCNDGARANDHSFFTTFRHSATSRLHASWQISGIVAGAAVVARVADPGRLKAVAWSCDGSNFSSGNFVDGIVPR